MSHPIIIGIDPGIKGAIAVIKDRCAEDLDIFRIPLKDNRLDTKVLYAMFSSHQLFNTHFFIEDVISYGPKSNSGQKTRFSDHGKIIAVLELLGAKFTVVHPRVWQYAILGDLKGKDSKEESVKHVMARFPDVNLTPGRKTKPDDGIADACCIAEYGYYEVEV